jgi:hypothetical protein
MSPGQAIPYALDMLLGFRTPPIFSRQLTGRSSDTDCIPPGITIVQEADVVVNYIDRNPDKRDLAAAALVVAAIDEAWCSQAIRSTER